MNFPRFSILMLKHNSSWHNKLINIWKIMVDSFLCRLSLLRKYVILIRIFVYKIVIDRVFQHIVFMLHPKPLFKAWFVALLTISDREILQLIALPLVESKRICTVSWLSHILLIFLLFLTASAAAKYVPGGDKMSEEELDRVIGKWSPLDRPGYLDDISGIIALLSNPESQWITGQTLQVSGGAHMS